MCTTCGCEGDGNKITMTVFGEKSETQAHDHNHSHEHHSHTHDHSHSHQIDIETDILSQNNLLAERNRGSFEAKNIFSLNIMSSSGSGKTAFLDPTV